MPYEERCKEHFNILPCARCDGEKAANKLINKINNEKDRASTYLTEEEIMDVISKTKSGQSPFRNIAKAIYEAQEKKRGER